MGYTTTVLFDLQFGMNALLWTAWFGHKQCLQMLLRAGAKANARNKNGYTFLHCCAQNNHMMAADIITEDLQEFDIDTVDDVSIFQNSKPVSSHT